MKSIRLLAGLLFLTFSPWAFSQVSHGGIPYFIQPSVLRASAASGSFFIEMPPFDLDSTLREDALNEGNMRGSLSFAHKFYTNIDIRDAVQTILPDGTTVRQIGIRSAGAYSINLLLRDFDIPPGGKLFVYNADHSYVIGSFDYRNNSAGKILPLQPVAGESVVVEYSEPADAPYKGRFIISEVNHDYRDILRAGREPGSDGGSTYFCMPDVLCSDAADETVRSTVLLMINGTVACTGSLLNNASDDGKPYLLTAVHCLNDSLIFPKSKDYYSDVSGTIVAFFNYNRPVCNTNIRMKGSEEMSLAGASARVILEDKDIALLEFFNSPPNYFNAYYAGWNRDLNQPGTIHTNIHHPAGAVKKYGMTGKTISIASNPALSFFAPDSYWKVLSWDTGSTYSGSSGSPLFDENQLVVGGLSSGSSQCSGTSPSTNPQYQTDFFFALGKGWQTGDSTNQLQTCLDPQNKGFMQYPGMDPNEANPVIREANAHYTEGDSLIADVLDSPNKGYVFGNSNLQTLEFAEEFNVAAPVEILGTYLLIPSMPVESASSVKISVYTGDSSPDIKIDSTGFVPQYLSYDTASSSFSSSAKSLAVPTETFVVFDKPVQVNSKKFFISYSVNYSAIAQFCVYNTKFQDASQANTAWVKDAVKGWVPAEAYEAKPLKTSLAIQPLLQQWNGDAIETAPLPGNSEFYYERSGRALTLRKPLEAQNAQVSIYSVSGQLLERIPVPKAQTTVILRAQPKGTVGIVKITSVYFSGIGKIIY